MGGGKAKKDHQGGAAAEAGGRRGRVVEETGKGTGGRERGGVARAFLRGAKEAPLCNREGRWLDK